MMRPGRHVIGTPSHAAFIAADTPYRVGFAGDIGDRAVTLRFSEELAPDQFARGVGESLMSQGLQPAQAMMLRNLLWARLERVKEAMALAPAAEMERRQAGKGRQSGAFHDAMSGASGCERKFENGGWLGYGVSAPARA